MRTVTPFIALLLLCAAAAPSFAASAPADGIDSHALDGCAYQLTLVAKGALPVAAAGLQPGTTLQFENGRMLFDSGDGGVCKISFQAEAIGSDVVRVTTKLPAALPKSQALAPHAKNGFIDVSISINGTITNDGKVFSGSLVWDERDDRSPHKITYKITGGQPTPVAVHEHVTAAAH
jgi:hypothetical protein